MTGVQTCALPILDDVPTNVSINEAVELAKQYANEDDYSFINGVLGAIAKELNLNKK